MSAATLDDLAAGQGRLEASLDRILGILLDHGRQLEELKTDVREVRADLREVRIRVTGLEEAFREHGRAS